ncbi:MAG: hypothetical protein HRT47_05505 [Candidatus Caenarcaniphilales bacterium]|nr:hypothetical protein [Candidatus Caenarcaniphilales bacterium]
MDELILFLNHINENPSLSLFSILEIILHNHEVVASLLGVLLGLILLFLSLIFMQLKRRGFLEMVLFFVVFTFMYSIALLEQSLTKFYTGLLSASVVYLIYYLGFKKELDEKEQKCKRDLKFIEKNIIKISDYIAYLFSNFEAEDYNIWVHNFVQIEKHVKEIELYECKDEKVKDFKKELLEKLFNPIINSIIRFRQNQIRNDKVYKAFLKRVGDSIHSEFHHIFTDEFYEIGKELIKATDKVNVND